MSVASLIALALTSASVPQISPTDSTLSTAVVTGTRTPKLWAETPVPTFVIGRNDILRSDATNLRELLTHELPNVEFSYTPSGHINLNFGGFSGQGLLFLVNGERMAGETMDNVDYSRINLSDVERIEIVRGASSALYGSAATGGVVNIITRQRLKSSRNSEASVRWGRHDNRRFDLNLGHNLGRFTHLFNMQHQAQSGYALHNPDDVALFTTYALNRVPGHRVWQWKDRWIWSPTSDFRLSARAGYFFREQEQDATLANRYRDFVGGVKAEWSVSPQTRVELAYHFDQYDKSDLIQASHRDIRDYSNVQHTTRALVSHDFTHLLPSDHGFTLTAGGDYLRDYLMSYQFEGQSRVQHSADAFVQADWTLSPYWEILGAVRYDHFSQGQHEHLTSKVSARYRQGAFTYRAGYGQGFRAPSLKELYMHYPINGLFVLRGNENLRPERSDNFHASVDWHRHHCLLTAAFGYNLVRQRITTAPPSQEREASSGLPYIDYINLPRLHAFSAQLSAQNSWTLRKGTVGLRLNYAFTHEEAQQGNSLTPYLPARPHAITARISYDLPWRIDNAWGIQLSGRWLSSIHSEEYTASTGAMHDVHYPAYALLRLATTLSLNRAWQLSLAADNLLNYRPRIYFYNAPTTDGIDVQVGATYRF